MRLERQTREHQVALTNTEERLLHNQQELDKVRPGWGGVPETRFSTTNDQSLLQMRGWMSGPVAYTEGAVYLCSMFAILNTYQVHNKIRQQ